jgi:hypothetical protein
MEKRGLFSFDGEYKHNSVETFTGGDFPKDLP